MFMKIYNKKRHVFVEVRKAAKMSSFKIILITLHFFISFAYVAIKLLTIRLLVSVFSYLF